MLKFGPLTQLNDILVKIGGIALMPHEARSEQDGTICRPLPMATDARFQQPIKANVNDAIVGDNTNTEQGADGEGENSESTDNGGNGNEGQANEGQANEENTEGDQQPEASESEQTESETKK